MADDRIVVVGLSHRNYLVRGEGNGEGEQRFNTGDDTVGFGEFFQAVGKVFEDGSHGYGGNAHGDGYVGVGGTYVGGGNFGCACLTEVVRRGQGCLDYGEVAPFGLGSGFGVINGHAGF